MSAKGWKVSLSMTTTQYIDAGISEHIKGCMGDMDKGAACWKNGQVVKLCDRVPETGGY